jgi:hypothetical protein
VLAVRPGELVLHRSGPQQEWPGPLRLLVDLRLDRRVCGPDQLGPDLLVFYNEAYIRLLGGDKHPWGLGRLASKVWPHPWPASEQHSREVVRTGRAYHSDDQRLTINRHGCPQASFSR